MKKLTRSSMDRMFYGVIGGVANYFNIDSTLLRLIFVIALLFTSIFPLLIVYIVAIFIMPEDRELK
ncbi:PspC domain-containing protein [Aquibacillus sediminis]|uniref:PspC domain-containing protein n=1 Tax=Aquibacillus sediminis TaxID=2574734 RepID=UPI0011084A64